MMTRALRPFLLPFLLFQSSALHIAFWTGYAGNWSGKDLTNVYGSELALANVAELLAFDHTVDVYVLQNVDDLLRGVRWRHQNTLDDHASHRKYDVMVVSRYINYFILHDARAIADRTYVWIHDVHPLRWYNNELLPATFVRNIDPVVDGWVAVSKIHKQILVDEYGFDFEKVAVIPNGISKEDVKALERPTTRVINSFIYASHPDRDLEILLRMFPQITEILPNATLDIYYRQIDNPVLLNLVGEQQNVRCIGFVTHEQLMHQHASADYWLYPTRFFETCCTTAMETALMGALHITSSTGGVGENSQGWIVPGNPGSPEFTQQVLAIFRHYEKNPHEKEELREKQRAWALEQTWDQRVSMWLELFQSQAFTAQSQEDRNNSGYPSRWADAPMLEAIHGNASRPVSVDVTNMANAIWYDKGDPDPTIGDREATTAECPAQEHKNRLQATVENEHKICLNMIVKDEALVLPRLIASIQGIIDYYVIVDTGSVDETMTVIEQEMDAVGIQGHLFERDWVNFGVNRNEALQLAMEHCKAVWVLFIDADDELVVLDPTFTDKLQPSKSYKIKKHSQDTRYALENLINIKITNSWSWRGAVHEYIELHDEPAGHVFETLDGVYIQVNIGEGARSQGVTAEQKFLKDAALLEMELEKDPSDARSMYYLGQSYRDAGRKEEALQAFRKRVKLTHGWDEETFFAQYQVACMVKELYGDESAQMILQEYLYAWELRPSRIEPLYDLAVYFRGRKNYAKSFLFAIAGANMTKPDDVLFVNIAAYEWRIKDELCTVAYYVGRYREGEWACRELLQLVESGAIPTDMAERFRSNLAFYTQRNT